MHALVIIILLHQSIIVLKSLLEKQYLKYIEHKDMYNISTMIDNSPNFKKFFHNKEFLSL